MATSKSDFISKLPSPLPNGATMVVSKSGLDIIIESEVSSKAMYNSKYKSPIWPGGDSGVTIGIGYDIGYCTPIKLAKDWGKFLSAKDLEILKTTVGLKGAAAQKSLTNTVKSVVVSWEAALEVFYTRSLPVYAKDTSRIYPGVASLPPDAQAALLSIVYNRGSSLDGDRRAEMRNIVPLVASGNLAKIAAEIRAMKRLWGASQKGLLTRRDREADLVADANFEISLENCIFV